MTSLALNSIKIQNYRTFHDIEVDGFGNVNLIVGKNNVGKTSLLEAIWLYATQGAPTTLRHVLKLPLSRSAPRPRRLASEENALSRLSLPRHLFYGRPEIVYGKKLNPIIISPLDTNPPLIIEVQVLAGGQLSLLNDTPDLELTIRLGDTLVIKVDLSLLRFELSDTNAIRPISAYYVAPNGVENEEIARFWDQSTLTEKEKQVVNALRLIESDVEAVNLVESDYGTQSRQPIIKLASERDPVPLSTMGDGMTRLFEIILTMVNCRNGIILVDEIENGIHYTIQPEMWRLIFTLARQLNVQVFATTHSLDCIRAFSYIASEDRKTAGIVTSLRRRERKPSEIVAVRFSENELEVVAREGLEVR